MTLVREYINFERHVDPKGAMRTGAWADMPKVGDTQKEPFDLFYLAKSICVVYKLPIKDYTPIDSQSNYNWKDGYQMQKVTMNLRIDPIILSKFMGSDYTDKIQSLLGKDYVPPMKLGVSSEQYHWIKNDSYEFTGNKTYIFVDAGGWDIMTDFSKKTNIDEWIPDYIKDHVIKTCIWQLRYKTPIFHEKIPQEAHMRDRNHIKINVKDYVKKYGKKDLEDLMKKNYMWTTSVKNWNIEKGILELID